MVVPTWDYIVKLNKRQKQDTSGCYIETGRSYSVSGQGSSAGELVSP